ncbi:hypothetical protein [Streptomyces acidicola]|uniref:hypothetical protein n=1 Tax=Streptomyces acidicola TaxID=2596892 RepID=UPI003824BFE1
MDAHIDGTARRSGTRSRRSGTRPHQVSVDHLHNLARGDGGRAAVWKPTVLDAPALATRDKPGLIGGTLVWLSGIDPVREDRWQPLTG